jgi:hypothetical protein
LGVLGPGDRQAERDVLAAGELLAACEDLLGGVEGPELIQRLTQQQRAARIQVRPGHRLDQSPHHPEVVSVTGQVGAADQDGWVRLPAGVQPPHGDVQRRRGGDGVGGLQPLRLGQQDRSCL